MINKNTTGISFDIEVSPNTGYFWSNPWQTSIIKTLDEGQILSVAWQFIKDGKKSKVYVLGQCDDPKYRPGVLNDKWLVQEFLKEYNKADFVLGQNSDNFDIKWLQGRMFIHGIKPTKPFKTFDTKKIAKGKFAFITNKLDDMAKRLKLGEKMKHQGFDLWEGVMAGDLKCWKTMLAYNKHDVRLTTDLWIEMLPWIMLPRAKWASKKVCKHCGENTMQRRGNDFVRANGSKYEKYSCTSCGKWESRDLVVENI